MTCANLLYLTVTQRPESLSKLCGSDGRSLGRRGVTGVEMSYFSDAFGVRKRVQRIKSKIILRLLV